MRRISLLQGHLCDVTPVLWSGLADHNLAHASSLATRPRGFAILYLLFTMGDLSLLYMCRNWQHALRRGPRGMRP